MVYRNYEICHNYKIVCRSYEIVYVVITTYEIIFYLTHMTLMGFCNKKVVQRPIVLANIH